jgi:hypothetical protein
VITSSTVAIWANTMPRLAQVARCSSAAGTPFISFVAVPSLRKTTRKSRCAASRAVVSQQMFVARLMAHLSRTILQRTAQIHRILDVAAASDPNAAKLQQTDRKRRHHGQRAYVEILLANGPLRTGVSTEEATDTYASLANPATYAFLTGDRGWTPARYEKWLAESLIRLLLD